MSNNRKLVDKDSVTIWPECLDLEAAAAYSGFSKWALRGWIGSGKLPRETPKDPYDPERDFRRIYVTRKDLDAFIENNRTSTTSNLSQIKIGERRNGERKKR